MCFSKGGILWKFVIKIYLIKCSTEVTWTQWQNFLQDPHNRAVEALQVGIFIPRHTIVAGYYDFTLDISMSVRLYFCFRMITWVNIDGFSPNLVCALILWRSGLELLMCKFCQICTELSAWDMPIFLFPDDDLCKHQLIFTKHGMCIDIVEIWFGLANGQISSNFDGVICPRHAHILVFRMITWVNVKEFNQTFYEGKSISNQPISFSTDRDTQDFHALFQYMF